MTKLTVVKPRRSYTRRQKVTAIIAAEMTNAATAAEQAGIPESTLRYWMDNPKFAELRAKTREEEASGFRVIVHRVQERLFELIPTMEPRDLTILLGVATDKSELLMGAATSRTEHRDLTAGFDDHESALLGDMFRKAIVEAIEA